ncbi:TIGR04219 family outer membrane beta-barrel protein [Paraferrimonas sp. SM1919]|uniref:TIGR04219 family outer membrane beta-barrel protein n=1 Tax=Paraferrimonas sp. SM1919 TaxID=2662263 RepID=UPI0013CF9E6A|nr:TIGR04219 family outer membrane beta-barrel protein [Paraferrimonas sp. SM1919]
MKYKTLALAAAISMTPAAHADMLGFVVGANAWNQSMTGKVQYGVSKIDTQEQLNIASETKPNFYADFEHPLPLIPNVRIQQSQIQLKGNNTLTQDIEFGGVVFPVSGNVESNIDFSHTDATIYYEILDNWVSVDVGLTARLFQGEASITSMAQQAKLGLDQALPMVYGKVKFELPLSGLYASVRGNGIGYSDKKFMDIEAAVGYETSIGLGLEAGYRQFELDFMDNDEEGADVKIDGAYLGVFYHF